MTNSRDEGPFEGRCACSAVRFRMTSSPLVVHACHCTYCQRESGAAFAVNAMIESERVELLEGTPELVTIPTASGKGQRVFRCPACKIALHSSYGPSDVARFVRTGTLLEPARVPPDVHIFTSTKLPWVVLGEGTPVVPEFYDRKSVWRAESLERLAALRARAK